MGTKQEQEPKSWLRMETKWKQSVREVGPRSRKIKWEQGGNEKGTRTTKWGQNGNNAGPKVGQVWEQSGTKWDQEPPKWDKSGNKVGTKWGQDWEQSGNTVGTKA